MMSYNNDDQAPVFVPGKMEIVLAVHEISIPLLLAAALCAVSVGLHLHGPVHQRHRPRLRRPSRHRRHCIWDCRRHCPDDGVSELAARYDAEARDKQLEADVGAGKLDAFAREALREHKAGRTTSP
jgi:hypothetical protein